MKITKPQLRRIIKEELDLVLNEGAWGPDSYETVNPVDRIGREQKFERSVDDFAGKVHDILYHAGYSRSSGKTIHKADAYQLVAKELGVETVKIARLWQSYLGSVKRDPEFANHHGVDFDGSQLSAIG